MNEGKNVLLRHSISTDLKKHIIISVAVTAAIVGFIALIGALVGEGSDSKLLNGPTVVMLVVGFVWTISMVNRSFYYALCFNCSRKTAARSVFAITGINVLFTCALSILAELSIVGISDIFHFGYRFKPMIEVMGVMKYEGLEDLVPVFGFQLLFFYFIFVTAMLVMALILRVGKWTWMGFWIFYMLLFLGGNAVADALKAASEDFGIDLGSGALVMIIVLSVLFSFLFVKLFRKAEMSNSFMGISKNT